MPGLTDRQRREAQFYDQPGHGRTRNVVAKYYAVSASSRGQFRALVAKLAAGADVLEVGCGSGAQTLRVAALARRAVGIDVADRRIGIARENARLAGLSNVEFKATPAERSGFPDSTFDLVFGGAILHHLDVDLAYSEIARILRPTGRAVFIEALGHNPLINLYRRRSPQLRTQDEAPLRLPQIRMAERFFGKVDVTYYHLISIAAAFLHRLPGGTAVRCALEMCDRALFTLAPPLRKHAWCALIEFSNPRKSG